MTYTEHFIKKLNAVARARWFSGFLLLMAIGLMFWAGYDSESALPFIQAATLLVVGWYAWQTFELTNEMKEQTREMKNSLLVERYRALVAMATEIERFDLILEHKDTTYSDQGARIELENVSEYKASNIFIRPWKDNAPWRLETIPNRLRNWEKGQTEGFRVVRREPESKRVDVDLEFQFYNVRSQQRIVRYRIAMEQVQIVESYTNGLRDTRATDEQPEFVRALMPKELISQPKNGR